MPDQETAFPPIRKKTPWNKGKLTGAKPPLRPKHVWSIRTKLQIEGGVRDLAMFNLAIGSKLRGCDVVAIKVDDVAAGGYTGDRATVRQSATLAGARAAMLDVTGFQGDAYGKTRSSQREGVDENRDGRSPAHRCKPTGYPALPSGCRLQGKRSVWRLGRSDSPVFEALV